MGENTEPAQDFNNVNKNEWTLKSQKVITDRLPNENINTFVGRHEQKRRVQAEADLIEALDLLNDPSKKEERSKFLLQFLE